MIHLDIVDDQIIIAKALKDVLPKWLPDVKIGKVCHTAHDYIIHLRNPHTTPPQVVLINYKMTGLNGVHLSQILQQHFEHIDKIAFSSDASLPVIEQFVQAGCKAFINKEDSPESLSDAIKTVANQQYFYNKYIDKKFVKQLLAKESKTVYGYGLTQNDVWYIHLCQTDCTDEQKAAVMHIGVDALHKKRGKLYANFDVHNQTSLIDKAVHLHIIQTWEYKS